VVINATGVWSDEIRALDEGPHTGSLRPAKGIHLSVPWEKVRCDIAVVIPVLKDKRSIFVVPWDDRVYVGTTDTDYDGNIDDPQCTPDDVEYLMRSINFSTDAKIGDSDVLGTWAGLRPLVASAKSERTADLSRRHSVTVSKSGMVSVTGGKLTTYRLMAADAVDAAARDLAAPVPPSCTEAIPLVGASGYAAACNARARTAADAGLSVARVEHLLGRYGSLTGALLELGAADPALGEPLQGAPDYLGAEVVYAVTHEGARHLEDVLARRTRAALESGDGGAAAARPAAELMAGPLGWSRAQVDAEVAGYLACVAAERRAWAPSP